MTTPDLQDASKQFRIITNGITWALQQRYRFLWWRYWGPHMHSGGEYETTCECLEDAQHAMARAIERYVEARRPWRVVQTGTEFIRGSI